MIRLSVLSAIFLIGSISCCSGGSPATIQKEMGLFIWHYMIKQKSSEKFIELMAPDSIFYLNGHAIESILRNEELQNAGARTGSQNVQNGYHLINFTNKQFYRYNSLSALKNEAQKNWQPIENKQVGVRFDYPFYNGEKFVSKDTVIGNRQYRLISFVNSGAMAKGAQVTFYLEPEMSSPIPFYTIQKKFKGRLSMISIIDQLGETRMILEYLQAPADSPIYKILKEIAQRHPRLY
ncbi:hypothetical protein [Chitinophaga sp. OAE865]|uniref:hypothetical protein n=1 Tax=Chitinophaga sp. OAE865 TaxID=2817898 RepID=UPI001AE4D938